MIVPFEYFWSVQIPEGRRFTDSWFVYELTDILLLYWLSHFVLTSWQLILSRLRGAPTLPTLKMLCNVEHFPLAHLNLLFPQVLNQLSTRVLKDIRFVLDK